MTDRGVRIGVIDSGLDGPLADRVAAWRSFVGDDCLTDHVGHGTRVCEVIDGQAPLSTLLVAKVFGERATTRPALIAEALDWLIGERVAVVNMSFGLAADRQVLADACRRAGGAGAILVASAPARGAPCYPAAYPDVIAVTGDARCPQTVVSRLDGAAMFGTWCASPERAPGASISGASIAAAHFTGLVADRLASHPACDRSGIEAHFTAVARYHGPERRARDGAA